MLVDDAGCLPEVAVVNEDTPKRPIGTIVRLRQNHQHHERMLTHHSLQGYLYYKVTVTETQSQLHSLQGQIKHTHLFCIIYRRHSIHRSG
jgi:hypothetical protein